MDVKKENVLAAYKLATDSEKALLRSLFPDLSLGQDNRPVTERIKTFEDACEALGYDHRFVEAYQATHGHVEFGDDEIAYLKLRIITAALNEGWQPQFTEDEYRYYPWFWLLTEEELADAQSKGRTAITLGEYASSYAGFAYAHSNDAPSNTLADLGSRLCFKSYELAVYAGNQFISLWADFHLIRK